MRLYEFIKFSIAKDQDWPSNSNIVWCFEKNVIYKREGKTHGIESHAIKHFIEFKPDIMKNIFNLMRKDILEYKETIYSINRTNKRIEYKENLNINLVNDNSLMNTLDFVNDKIFNGINLIGPEKLFKEYIQKITNEFKHLIENKTKNSINIDNLNNEEIDKLIKNKENINFKYINPNFNNISLLNFDLKDLSFIITREDSIQTMFIVDNNKIKLYFEKRF